MEIYVSAEADYITKYAASELQKYVDLFAEKPIDITVVIGKPDDTPDIADDQVFVIHPDGGKIYLYGGSPLAALWAVYELVSQWGILYTLHGDVIPPEAEIKIPQYKKEYKPRQRLRAWRIFNEHFTGPTSWSLKQQKYFITQLVKQKYNAIYFVCWPFHPFIDFEFNGVSRSRTKFGYTDPVILDENNIARELLPPHSVFTNPEFYGCETFADWHKRGVNYAAEVFSFAKQLGMTVVMSCLPYHIPIEFKDFLQKPVPSPGIENYACDESGDLFNDNHVALLKAQFDAFLNTYPMVDIFEINLPEHVRTNLGQFDECWAALDKRFGLSDEFDIEEIIRETGAKSLTEPERAIREVKMNLMSVESLHRLLDKTGFLRDLRSKGKRLALQAGLNCPSVIPIIAKAMWEDAIITVCADYTTIRTCRALRLMENVSTAHAKINYILTLQDDNIGNLPQMCFNAIDRLIQFAADIGWNGYLTRYWPIGDLDPISYFLSKCSWDAEITSDEALADFLSKLYGSEFIKPFRYVYRLLEEASVLLDTYLGGIFPVSNLVTSCMFLQNGGSAREHFRHAVSIYREAFSIISKTNAKADYLASRLEFSINALDGMIILWDACGLNDNTAQAAQYRLMIEKFTAAVTAMSKQIRDDSDIGNLAVYYHVFIRKPSERLELYGSGGK